MAYVSAASVPRRTARFPLDDRSGPGSPDDRRAAALAEGPVTIDLDTTDVEVYGRRKRGVAYNHQGQRAGRPHVAAWAETEVVPAADLGRRSIYDGTRDPVLVAQLVVVIQGRAQPQAQNVSNTPDPTVTGQPVTNGSLTAIRSAVTASGPSGTELRVETAGADGTPDGQLTVRISRILRPADVTLVGEAGQPCLSATWRLPDSTQGRGILAFAQYTHPIAHGTAVQTSRLPQHHRPPPAERLPDTGSPAPEPPFGADVCGPR